MLRADRTDRLLEGKGAYMKQVLNLSYYELKAIFKDPILLAMVFVAPFIYACLFGLVYVQGILTAIPLGIVDLDHSAVSREIREVYQNDPSFKVTAGISTYEDLKAAMNNGTVRVGVIIPEDLQEKLARQEQGEVLTVYDASNLIWGFNIRKNNRQVVNRFNQQFAAASLAKLGLDSQQISEALNLVDCNTEIWYNPTLSYANFLFLGLMMMVIHQIGFLSVCLIVPREKENHTWIQFQSTAISKSKIILGKCLPYFIIHFFNYTMLLVISAKFVHVKIDGNVMLLILLGLLYVAIITFFGFFISTHVPNSLQTTRFLMLLSVPLFLLSGFSWSSAHMAVWITYLAELMPFTWMSRGIRMLSMKEAGFSDLSMVIAVLSLMALAAIFFSCQWNKTEPIKYRKGMDVNMGLVYPADKLKKFGDK